MKIPLKTRQEMANELNYTDIKTFMRHLVRERVVLPTYVLLTPRYQKRVYEVLGYPEGVEKEWYAKY